MARIVLTGDRVVVFQESVTLLAHGHKNVAEMTEEELARIQTVMSAFEERFFEEVTPFLTRMAEELQKEVDSLASIH